MCLMCQTKPICGALGAEPSEAALSTAQWRMRDLSFGIWMSVHPRETLWFRGKILMGWHRAVTSSGDIDYGRKKGISWHDPRGIEA